MHVLKCSALWNTYQAVFGGYCSKLPFMVSCPILCFIMSFIVFICISLWSICLSGAMWVPPKLSPVVPAGSQQDCKLISSYVFLHL